MDKLKIFLAVVKKYQFWVTCGAIVLIAMVCWWLATNGLASLFQQRKVKLESAFKSAVAEPKHPNQTVIDKIQQQHELLKRGVFDAWQILYSQQKKNNPVPTVLGANFRRQFEVLRESPGPKQELGRGALEDYQNFIKNYIPTLLTTGDILRPAEAKEPAAPGDATARGIAPAGNARRGDAIGGERRPGGPADGRMPGGAAGRNPADEEELVGTVVWNPTDFHALETRFDLSQTPSTLAVLLTQEDLWVVEALLRVIRDTNRGATNNASAPVKQIDALQIGRDAVGVGARAGGGQSMMRAGPAGPGGLSGPGGGMPPGLPQGRMMMEGPAMPGVSAAGTGAAGDDQKLVENRYVDEKGEPLPSVSEYPYAQHPYAEFKMMPIRMILVMDQRKLPSLLVECANSTMPIEVRRVNLLKTRGGTIDVAAASNTAARGQVGMGRGGFAESNMVRGATDQETSTYDMPVEISGIIYIYNPPDRQKLGTGTASAEKPAGAAAEAAVPGAAAEPVVPAAAPGKAGPEAPGAATPVPGAPVQPAGAPPAGAQPAGAPPAKAPQP